MMIKTLHKDDRELLEGLIEARPSAVRRLYDDILPAVIYWVEQNNGTEDDARDLFQEALIALFRRLENGEFELTCTLKSFMRIICRNLWLTHLRDRRKIDATPLEEVEPAEPDADLLGQLERSERNALYFRHFDDLGEKCRQILAWFFEKVPLAEIARRLGSSENYIKKRKFECKEKLIRAVREDPRFEELS